MIQEGSWRWFYEKALLETDEDEVSHSIEGALEAINDRREDALHGRMPLDERERRALDDASRTLRFLQQERAA